MLSYRHAFHAGNFADVFKHSVLVQLLRLLTAKPKPLFYLDTHAGAGYYDLHSEAAQKNREYRSGIAHLWALAEVPEPVAAYLEAVRTLNARLGAAAGMLRWYPGSAELARHFSRPGDRLLLTELHRNEAGALQEAFRSDPRISARHQDGYQALTAALPPRERRGLVFIDPGFERRDELEHLSEGLLQGYRRWPTGVFAVWYPIIARLPTAAFQRRLQTTGIAKLLRCELCLYPDDNPLGLNGSGLLIINPPWPLHETLEGLLPWLWQRLSPQGRGRYGLDWLSRD